jgi:hypothetical protein
VPAALMAVPEAAMHENDGVVFREDEIWTHLQQPGMEPVAQSGSVEEASESQLRLGVSLANPRHHLRAGPRVDDVWHRKSTKRHASTNTGRC